MDPNVDHSRDSAPLQFNNNYFPPPPPSPAGRTPKQGPSVAPTEARQSGFGERLHNLSAKIAGPVNGLANSLGCEAFWPTTLDKECDKAARILLSFCEETTYCPVDSAGFPNVSLSRRKALIKIPHQVIASAAGLAIFTAFRSGTQFSWGSGSGVVVARQPDGSWSPPSSFAVNTFSAGFMFAFDVYDCVCVLRTPEAVAAFAKTRLSFGGEIAIAAGPVGTGASLEAVIDSSKDDEPVWSYMKSRGLYIGAQIDGTVITARDKANEEFYGAKVMPGSILKGQVPARGPSWPGGAWGLMEALRAVSMCRRGS
ncbi:hypothetical protein ACJ41O_006803 [Fusarium nematophilum]